MIGEIVGNYRILKLIGEGGMGVVYLAEHPGMGRRAAVKVLHAGLAHNQEIATRFFNEARAANSVRHPGIVEVFDLGALPSGATYIIMEFLEGESLASRIRRAGPLPIAEAVDIAAQTAEVLAAAHAKGIVHRDLKPDNLFLVPDPRAPGRELVKVLDFGIAKLNLQSSGSGGVRTRTGAVMGTPLYMSPEQCRGTREVDLRTDVYALGIILYELVCGRPPFLSEGQGELIHMHIAVAPEPPRKLNPSLSPALERVILAALEKDPAARTQTMGDLLRALRAAAAAPAGKALPTAPNRSAAAVPLAQTTFSATASAYDVEAPRRRSARWPLFALVGAAALGGAAFALRSSGLSSSAAPPPAPAATTVTPAAPPPAPAPPPPAKIVVSIASQPAGARVVRERDGADIGVTPFKESWPAAAGVEKMRLELDGYRPQPLVVPLDRGVALELALTKLEREPAKRARGPAKAPAKAPPPRAPRPEAPARPSEPVPL
ncbi:MAG TPA: serine/threonine-protein kinase [Polyangia bacterium]|nr:serine/threonine-protein kinase [Polyangia bacterium]